MPTRECSGSGLSKETVRGTVARNAGMSVASSALARRMAASSARRESVVPVKGRSICLVLGNCGERTRRLRA